MAELNEFKKLHNNLKTHVQRGKAFTFFFLGTGVRAFGVGE